MRCYCNKKHVLVVSLIADNPKMVVQTNRYVNFSKLFEWVLVH